MTQTVGNDRPCGVGELVQARREIGAAIGLDGQVSRRTVRRNELHPMRAPNSLYKFGRGDRCACGKGSERLTVRGWPSAHGMQKPMRQQS
jgi:hypothetical protein